MAPGRRRAAPGPRAGRVAQCTLVLVAGIVLFAAAACAQAALPGGIALAPPLVAASAGGLPAPASIEAPGGPDGVAGGGGDAEAEPVAELLPPQGVLPPGSVELPDGELVQGSKKAGQAIPGRFIVTFAPNATTSQALASLQRRVVSVAAAARRGPAKRGGLSARGRELAAATAADDVDPSAVFKVEHVLGALEDERREVSVASIEGAAPRPRPPARRPPRAAVVVVGEGLDGRDVVRAMSAAAGVRAVVEDRWVSVAQSATTPTPSCVPPSFLAGTVAAPDGLDWPGCNVPGVTKVAWFGERCNSYMTGTRWVGMYAFYASNSSLVPGCVRYRSRSSEDEVANVAEFGECGVAPTVAEHLPTRLCSDNTLAKRNQAQGCVPLNQTAEFRARLDAPVKCHGVSTAEAVFRGVRCGPGMRWVRWSSITLPEGGHGCRFSRKNNDPRWNAQWLGHCGVPPQYNTAMPTRICQEDSDRRSGGDSPPVLESAPATPADGAPSPIPPPVSPGSSGGADPARERAPAPAPSPKPGGGDEGEEEEGAAPSPSPAPAPPPAPSPPRGDDGFTIPKVPLLEGETVYPNMKRIGVDAGGVVPDFSTLGIAAAIIDTGIDRRHHDLNVVGGKSFCSTDSTNDPYVDGLGHGTHVAGILGAKNNGKGIIGAAPGIPIYSLKVLASDGTGATSDLLRAYEWLYYNARALKIRVVNLSLTGGGGDTDPQCEWTAALARQGITVVAATGNNKANMMNEAPGACPKALAVTSFTDKDGIPGNDSWSWFSNWLPAAAVTEARRKRIVAAPGDSIISTYPVDRPPTKNLPQGYHSMSGTSMACPHVTGIVARCYAAGECTAEADTEAEKITAIMKDYAVAHPEYGFTGDAVNTPSNNHYFGYAVHADRW